MSTVIIKPLRRDGKHPVTLSYQGMPNDHGGLHPARNFRALWSAEKINDHLNASPNATLVDKSFHTFERKLS